MTFYVRAYHALDNAASPIDALESVELLLDQLRKLPECDLALRRISLFDFTPRRGTQN